MSVKARGFTLIELLVVIAIISILAAIIFPVFSAAKDKGRQTVCLSNLKQLGTAMQMYADEWDGCFPTARIIEGGDGNPSGNWAGCYFVEGKCSPELGQIFPYVKSRELYVCPSARNSRLKRITAPDAYPYPLSYGMNDGLSYLNINMAAAPASRVGLLVHEDASTLDDGDFNWSGFANGPGGFNAPTRMHTGGACVIYCDLHAKWAHQDVLIGELKNGDWNPYQP
ncbi:MAG: DUF1559 family PulG-like putative transporter [Armatimonadota bacterium]